MELSFKSEEFARLRCEMVECQIRKRGIRDERVLQALSTVPRHLFVHPDLASSAYSDGPLPIGEGQTISQPFMVAAMAEALGLKGQERVLEIGAGSGYQAAVLSLLASEVITVETRPRLVALARENLARIGYSNVRAEEGDGSLGWPAEAPYDAILVSAAAPLIPQPLFEQLTDAGHLVIPVGNSDFQQVLRVVKNHDQLTRESLYGCRYVPLIGRHGWSARFKETAGE
jgi:protein-L-isoaspartate(D-aspartate) O-methyltransferase